MSIRPKTCLGTIAHRCLTLPLLLAAAYAGNVTIRRADSERVAVAVDATGGTSAASSDSKLIGGSSVHSSNEGHALAPSPKALVPATDIKRHVQVVVDALGQTSPSDASSASSDDFTVSHTSIIRQNRMGARSDNLLGIADELGLPLDGNNMRIEDSNKLGHRDDPNVTHSGGLALKRLPSYFGDVVQHLAKAQMPFAAPVVSNGRRPFGFQLPKRSIRMAVCLAWIAGGLFVVGYWLRYLLTPTSSVLFCSDPSAKEFEKEQLQITCDAKDCEAFLKAFNAVPEKVQLRISGHRPNDQKGVVGRYVHWFWRSGKQADMAFTAYLDLKLFIAEGQISREDLCAVRAFLDTKNPLETLIIRKEIKWDGLQEVTKSIRDRLHELGFSGAVDVVLEGNDRVSIHHNHQWTNFIHSPVTAVLACCSVLGGFVLYPYMWARRRRTSIHSTFRVNVHAKDYWDLVEVGIDAQHGFVLR